MAALRFGGRLGRGVNGICVATRFSGVSFVAQMDSFLRANLRGSIAMTGKKIVFGIVTALFILAVQLLRWEVVGAGNGAAYKLDRLTGGVTFILGTKQKTAEFEQPSKKGWKFVLPAIDE